MKDFRPWLPSHLSAAVDAARELGDPDRIVMNALEYADIRKFGRDVLDIESDPKVWKTGRMAVLYNVQVFVTREQRKGLVTVVDSGGRVLVHRYGPRDMIGDPHPGDLASCRACSVAYVLSS